MLMAMVVAGSSSPFCGRSNPFLLNDANDLVYNPDGNGESPLVMMLGTLMRVAIYHVICELWTGLSS